MKRPMKRKSIEAAIAELQSKIVDVDIRANEITEKQLAASKEVNNIHDTRRSLQYKVDALLNLKKLTTVKFIELDEPEDED